MGARDVGRRVLVGLAILILLAGCSSSPSPKPAAGTAAASASPPLIYNAKANPQADIDAAVAAAKADGRRVLIEFGADWCEDCTALAADFASPQIKPFLDANFHVVPVYIGNWDTNMAVEGKYKAGSHIHADDRRPRRHRREPLPERRLSSAASMSVADVMADLQKWAPSPPLAPAEGGTTPVSPVAPGASPTLAPTVGTPADDGARIVDVTTLDARTRDLTIDSPAVGTVMVRLLIPSGFDAQPSTRWPVLYLLHGAHRVAQGVDGQHRRGGDDRPDGPARRDARCGRLWGTTRTGGTAARAGRRSGRRSTSSNCASCWSGTGTRATSA